MYKIIAAIVVSMILLTSLSTTSSATVRVEHESFDTNSQFCIDPVLAMSAVPVSDEKAFTLVITVSQDMCSDIAAKAVVYSMPDNGAWPQRLVSVYPFTIPRAAGVTRVFFDKGCKREQFDVLLGDSVTPEIISPLGEWHGPLLFQIDDSTSLQWFGAKCEEVTATTTTTSTTTTTTTVPVDVIEPLVVKSTPAVPAEKKKVDTLEFTG